MYGAMSLDVDGSRYKLQIGGPLGPRYRSLRKSSIELDDLSITKHQSCFIMLCEVQLQKLDAPGKDLWLCQRILTTSTGKLLTYHHLILDTAIEPPLISRRPLPLYHSVVRRAVQLSLYLQRTSSRRTSHRGQIFYH